MPKASKQEFAIKIFFSYFSCKTYVVGTPKKKRLFSYPSVYTYVSGVSDQKNRMYINWLIRKNHSFTQKLMFWCALIGAFAVITVDMVISSQANISDLCRIFHPNYFFVYQEILNAFLSSADIFQNQLFRKTLSGLPSECQTVWIQIRLNILSGLIWVQTVCKCYQQTTLVGKEWRAQSRLLKNRLWLKKLKWSEN